MSGRFRLNQAAVGDEPFVIEARHGGDAVVVAVVVHQRHARLLGSRGEQEIRDSDLDWTIFRPPSLTGKAATGAYRTAIDRNVPHAFTVSRADLAACMLARLDDPATVHRHVSIAS